VSTSFKIRLPATSANLGPGFDATAVALEFHLEIEAEAATEFSIEASGRNSDECARLEGNLILEVYREVLARENCHVQPLRICMQNGIPLGMGCGSSAAGRLAALALAVHFGELPWSDERILEEACVLEGHPDNAAACWLGGFVTAAMDGRRVHWARVEPPKVWRALIAMPANPLATSKARAVLPESYSRADAVANVQSAALLGLAFAQGRGDLLRIAMADRIHQPYRQAICPLLPLLLPFAGTNGILGVALSGAGPSVLLVVEGQNVLNDAVNAVQQVLEPGNVEILMTTFSTNGASRFRSRNS
jgi:homoserine kinase